VTEVRKDGSIRLSEDDAEHGQVHQFLDRNILAVDRVHGA
jgi:hypothetical protein